MSIEENVKFKVNKIFLDKYKMKSEKDLQENIKQNLLNQYGEYLHQIEKKELMDILDSKNKFDVPEGIFDEEFNAIWHRLEHAKKDNKLDEDDKGLSDEKLKDTSN